MKALITVVFALCTPRGSRRTTYTRKSTALSADRPRRLTAPDVTDFYLPGLGASAGVGGCGAVSVAGVAGDGVRGALEGLAEFSGLAFSSGPPAASFTIAAARSLLVWQAGS
jgi:hypothetical protein